MLGRTETRTRDRIYCQTMRTVRDIYETIEQELRPAVCKRWQTDLRQIIVDIKFYSVNKSAALFVKLPVAIKIYHGFKNSTKIINHHILTSVSPPNYRVSHIIDMTRSIKIKLLTGKWYSRYPYLSISASSATKPRSKLWTSEVAL